MKTLCGSDCLQVPALRSVRWSCQGTHVWLGQKLSLSFDQAGLVPGAAAQCPMMLFCGLYRGKVWLLESTFPEGDHFRFPKKTTNPVISPSPPLGYSFLLDAKQTKKQKPWSWPFQVTLPFSLTDGIWSTTKLCSSMQHSLHTYTILGANYQTVFAHTFMEVIFIFWSSPVSSGEPYEIAVVRVAQYKKYLPPCFPQSPVINSQICSQPTFQFSFPTAPKRLWLLQISHPSPSGPFCHFPLCTCEVSWHSSVFLNLR